MSKQEFAPVTPGSMLTEEFLAEYGLSQNQLAKATGIWRRITADTAVGLKAADRKRIQANRAAYPRVHNHALLLYLRAAIALADGCACPSTECGR